MGATFTSLPPEVLLEILSYLPRPTTEGRLPRQSPLIATAATNKQLRLLSQQLLFESVRLRGKEQVERWMASPARKWTTELSIGVGPAGPVHVSVWLNRVFGAGLAGKDGKRGRSLKVLMLNELEQGDLRDGWCRADGLKGRLAPPH